MRAVARISEGGKVNIPAHIRRAVGLERFPPDRNPSYALMGVPARPFGTIHRSPVVSSAGETIGLEER
jgi:hypothetical protein